ncbi:MAG TPA: hypothetical protein VH300_17950 [Thermoleophilaceae bacterium]|nr:hypothetical protein [Thermoleophilaceae bacterium]
MRRATIALGIAFVVLAAGSGVASAADPGLWIKTSQLTKPAYYRQGLASDPATGDVYYSGSFVGIYRTHDEREIVTNTNPIPKDVAQTEQYNHIGDIALDAGEGGRLLLPLESYQPFQPDQNPSKTGSIGVMDAKTLEWKYYVKLDPSEIQKTQWVATDPQSGLVWTISGSDLLAYSLADLNPANAAPAALPIHSVRRLVNAAPDGAGGAVLFGGRLYLSTQVGSVNRVVSVDTTTGASQVEIERVGTLEPEGLDAGAYLDGLLHWELVPGGGLSSTQLVNFVPRGAHLSLSVKHARVKAAKQVTIAATAYVYANGRWIPLRGVEIRLAGKHADTSPTGHAKLGVKLTRGAYRIQAFYRGLRSAVRKIRAT